MKATHITHELNTRRKLANRVIKALNDLTECDNGTIRNPFEAASVRAVNPSGVNELITKTIRL